MSASTTPAPEPGGGDPLRELLRRRIAQAEAETAAGNAPGEAAVTEIKRLEELLRARDALRPPPRRSAMPTVLVAAAIALLVGALLALRMPRTEATLALDLTSVVFRVAPGEGRMPAREVTLSDWASLDALEVDHISEVVLERTSGVPETPLVEIRAAGDQPVSLRPISLPIGTWVRVNGLDDQERVAIELAHPTRPLELRVDVRPGSDINPKSLEAGLDLSLPAQPVLLRALPSRDAFGCARLALRMHIQHASGDGGATGLELGSGLAIDALLFSRLEPERLGSVSTLVGGSLRFDEVGGESVKLQRGQRLQLTLASPDGDARPMRLLRAIVGAATSWAGLTAEPGVPPVCIGGILPEPIHSAGRIERIELAPGLVRVTAGATVARADAGSRSGTRPLMPTLLAWLRSWPEIPLYWGTLVTLCTLAWTGLSWWRGGR